MIGKQHNVIQTVTNQFWPLKNQQKTPTMPKRKATKSCQTDYVFMDKQEVETIINQRIGNLETEIKRLDHDLKTNEKKKDPSGKEIEQLLAPDLMELKELILKVQEEICQLQTNHEKLTNDVDSLNNLQLSTEVAVEALDGRSDSMEEEFEQKIGNLNKQLVISDQEFQAKLDDFEQKSKLRNLRLFGLDEEEGEDLTRKVIDFVQRTLSIEIKPTEVVVSRVGNMQAIQSKPRDVLVTFDSMSLRNSIYKKKILPRQQSQHVFVNEDLMQRRGYLFFQARKMRKQQKLFGVWTQAGNILVKLNPDSKPTAVSNVDEIKTLIDVNNIHDSDIDNE